MSRRSLHQQTSDDGRTTSETNNNPTKQVSLRDEQVNFVFREPHILTGYRLPNQPWSYYLSSVGWLHNETLNVWTHAVGCVCVLARALLLVSELGGFGDPRSYPVVGFAVGCFLSNFLSTSAHLFHSKSPWHHYVLYSLDYAGITFYNLGNGIASMYSCSHPRNYRQLDGVFLPVLVLLSGLSFVACVLTRLRYKGHVDVQRKLIMVAVLGSTAAFLAWPMVGRYVDCVGDEACSLFSSLGHITVVFVFFVLDALSYAGHFPERVWPGAFDVWGHGHQWFHVIVMVTQQLQLHALHVDLVTLRRGDHATIDLPSVLGSFLLLALAEGVILGILLPVIARMAAQGKEDGDKSQ